MQEFRAHEPDAARWQSELIKLQSELARDRPRTAAPVMDPVDRRRPRGSSKFLLVLAALALILAVLFGPGILGSILDRWDQISNG